MKTVQKEAIKVGYDVLQSNVFKAMVLQTPQKHSLQVFQVEGQRIDCR